MPQASDVPPIRPYTSQDFSATASNSTLPNRLGVVPRSGSSTPHDGEDTTTISEPTEGDPTDLVKQRQEEEEQVRNDGSKLIEPEPASTQGRGWRKGWKWIKIVLGFLLDQWFVLGVGFVIGMAAAFPNVARTNGILKAQYTIKYLLVAIIFFVSGLTLPLRNLYRRAGDWKLHIVTQSTCFFVFPTIVFAIINCVRAGDPTFQRFSRNALIGMQVMSVVPTTVSSNVVMTGQAGGDEAAATCEVVLGNLVGTFLSPALLEMFFSAQRWEFGRPDAGRGGGIGEVYRQVIQQLGFTVFIPLFVGEVIQYIWPVQTKLVRTKLRLGKVGSLCLLGVVWSTFSTAFYENAFEILTGEAIAFIVTVNIGLYGLLSVLLFLVARKIPFKGQPLFDGPTTIALLFCGAAKGAALGAPIVAILYSGLPPEDGATISLPIVLYQGSQIVLGQITVAILKAWHRRVKADDERRMQGEKEEGVSVETSEKRTPT
ncbi:Rch1p [Sporobolomyces salmoneus]|uniref:Rch1p n=1 Tax=Sporobolomyces salmoneus TaxID=183962 RepID=UPI00317A9651